MKILILHGPNLNMLGRRNPEYYGSFTLDDLYEELVDEYPSIEFTYYQSNHEGELIDVIQESLDEDYDGLIINPGAYTHTSIAIRDALELVNYLKVEVHLSDLTKREVFRQVDMIKDVCDACFMGKKIESYFEAVEYILKQKENAQ